MVRIDRNLLILNLQPGELITEGHKIFVLRRVKTNYPAWGSEEGRGISVVVLERETIGHRVQRLFPHGSWVLQFDKTPMGRGPYNCCTMRCTIYC